MKNCLRSTFRYLPFVLFIFIVSGCDSKEENTAEVVKSHFERSQAYKTQGQYRAAIIEARNIIKKDPKNNTGYFQLARLFIELGNYKSASNILESIPTADAESQLLLAEAYARQRKFTSTANALEEYKFQGGDDTTTPFRLLMTQILASKNQDKEAFEEIQSIINQSPENLKAQNMLVGFYFEKKQYSEANTLVKNALKKDTRDPQTLFIASQLAYLENNLPLAEEHLTNALLELPETDIILPIRSQVLRQLTNVLIEQGRTTEALAYTKLLAETNPEGAAAQSQFKQALTALSEGNIEEAEKILQEIYKKFPSNTMVALYLGLIDFQQGDFSSASELLTKNLDVEISSVQVIQASALSLLRQNKITQAHQMLKEAIATHQDEPKLLALFGLTALQSKAMEEEGIIAIQRSLAMAPEMISLRLSLARHYRSKNKIEQAQAQLDKVLKDEPGHVVATKLYVNLKEAMGKKGEATTAIEIMLKNRPKDFSAINLAARYSLVNGNIDEAKARFESSLSVQPNNPGALASLGLISMREGNYSKAKSLYKKVIDIEPASPVGYKGLVTAMEADGEAKEAIAVLEEYGNTLDNPQPTAIAVAAEYFIRKGDLKKATFYMGRQTGLEQTAYSEDIALNLAVASAGKLIKAENWSEARKIVMEAVKLNDNSLRLELLLADIERLSGNFNEAEQLVNKLLSDSPNNITLILGKVRLLDSQNKAADADIFLMNKFDETLESKLGEEIYRRRNSNKIQVTDFLEKWKAASPNNPAPYTFMAFHAQENDKPNLAIQYYHDVLNLTPNNAVVLNNLAWLYHEKSNPKAVETAKKAHELSPKSPAIMDTYGWILVQTGNTVEGRKLLKLASKSAPKNKEIEAHYKASLKE